jgi:hypothetical protein
MSVNTPVACRGLCETYEKIKDERDELANELKSAAPGEKGAIASKIKGLLPSLYAAQKAYLDCVAAHRPPTSTFQALVEVFLPGQLHTSGKDSLTLELDPVKKTCTLDTWPDLLLAPISVAGHDNVVILVKLDSTQPGSYDKATGAMSFAANFTVDPQVFGASASHLALNFTTGKVTSPLGDETGKPMDAQGNFVLVAAGKLQGGTADGFDVKVRVTGRFQPHP